jgi:hypothetical protein
LGQFPAIRVDSLGQLHRLKSLQPGTEKGLALSVLGFLRQVHNIHGGLPQQRPVQARQPLCSTSRNKPCRISSSVRGPSHSVASLLARMRMPCAM